MLAHAIENTESRSAVIEHLREQIQKVQAAPRQWLMGLSTGVKAIDALGLFRLGCAVELSGEEAGGRTTMALSLVASACREKRLAAWVDGPAELYPPAAVPMGVELKRLLVVRPKAPGQLVWSAVQLLRSGAFACVVLDVTHTGVRLTLNDAKKLNDAARAGGALLVVMTTAAAPAQGLVRAELCNVKQGPLRVVQPEEEGAPELCLEIMRSSHGGVGRQYAFSRERLLKVKGFRARSATRVGPQAAPGLLVPQVTATPSLRRPKRNLMRDGHGIDGARIGRDTPFRFSVSEERTHRHPGEGRDPARQPSHVAHSAPRHPGEGRDPARRPTNQHSPLLLEKPPRQLAEDPAYRPSHVAHSTPRHPGEGRDPAHQPTNHFTGTPFFTRSAR